MDTPTSEEVVEAIQTLEEEFRRLQDERYVLLRAAQNVVYEERRKNPDIKEFSCRYMRDLEHAVQFISRKD